MDIKVGETQQIVPKVRYLLLQYYRSPYNINDDQHHDIPSLGQPHVRPCITTDMHLRMDRHAPPHGQTCTSAWTDMHF